MPQAPTSTPSIAAWHWRFLRRSAFVKAATRGSRSCADAETSICPAPVVFRLSQAPSCRCLKHQAMHALIVADGAQTRALASALAQYATRQQHAIGLRHHRCHAACTGVTAYEYTGLRGLRLTRRPPGCGPGPRCRCAPYVKLGVNGRMESRGEPGAGEVASPVVLCPCESPPCMVIECPEYEQCAEAPIYRGPQT